MSPARPVLAIALLLAACAAQRVEQTTVANPIAQDPVPVPTPPPALKTAVFIGDSLVAGWDTPKYFPGMPYTNKGVPGNNTSQMLARFDTDVVALKPDIVLVWGSANDLSMGTVTNAENDLTSMYTGIKVVACTVAPHRGTNHLNDDAVVALNQWIKNYASAHSFAVADFYSILVDPNDDNQLKATLTIEGIHLNASGYEAINPLAANALK